MSTKSRKPLKAKSSKTKINKSVSTKKHSPRVRKAKMAKPNRPACIFLLVILGVATIVAVTFITIYAAVGNSEKNHLSLPRADAEKFAGEYSEVSSDNVFVYKTGQEVIDILEHGTGVVFLGFPSCPWCQRYAKYLNEVAKEKGITTIYYHNTYEDWQNNTPEYQKITQLLSSTLQYDNEGLRHLYVPDAAFVIDGRLIANDYETSKDTAGAKTPAEYWTDTRVEVLKNRLGSYMEQIKNANCDSACDR